MGKKKLGLKALSLCLSAILLTAGLCGCGGKEDTKKGTTSKADTGVTAEVEDKDSKADANDEGDTDDNSADVDTDDEDTGADTEDRNDKVERDTLASACSVSELQGLYADTQRIVLRDIDMGMYKEPIEIELSEELCKEFAQYCTEFDQTEYYGAKPMYALDVYNSDGELVDTLEVSEYSSIGSTAGIYFDRTGEFEAWLEKTEMEHVIDFDTVFTREPAADYFTLMSRADSVVIVPIRDNNFEDMEEYYMSIVDVENFTKALTDGCKFKQADDDTAFDDLNLQYGLMVYDEDEGELYDFYVTDKTIYTGWGYEIQKEGLFDLVSEIIYTSEHAVG